MTKRRPTAHAARIAISVQSPGGRRPAVVQRLAGGAVLAWLATAAAGPRADAGWVTGVVDDRPGAGWTTSLAVGPGDELFAAYHVAGDRALYLARRVGAGAWTSAPVDTSGWVGEWPSIVVTPEGRPAISYYDRANARLLWTIWEDRDRDGDGSSDGWVTEVVDDPHGSYQTFYSSMALAPDGTFTIAYQEEPPGRLRLAARGPAGWSTQILEHPQVVGIGSYASIGLIPQTQRPAISYHDKNDDAGFKVIWQDADGNWTIETFDPGLQLGAQRGRYSSLAIDSTGRAHVSYRDDETRGLKYARREPDGTWNVQLVDGEGDVGLWTSIALDAGAHPRIAYQDSTEQLLKTAYWDGQAWGTEVVDPESGRGLHTDVAYQSDGTAVIIYHDSVQGILRYAELHPDLGPPVVQLLAPVGGEAWPSGSTQTIRWTASDDQGVTAIDLLLARDGVDFSEVIAQGIPNSGSFQWVVTAPTTGSARVRVLAHDAAGNAAQASSAANFGIAGDQAVFDAWTLATLSSAGGSLVRADLRRGLIQPVAELSASLDHPQLAGSPLGAQFYVLTKTAQYPAQILTVASQTGEVQSSLPIPWPTGLVGLAVDPVADQLYSTLRYSSSQALVRLDLEQSRHAFLGDVSFSPPLPSAGWDAMAFSPTGILYGAGADPTGQELRLWRIDLGSLAATLVGTLGSGPYAVSGAAFLGDQLWITDAAVGLAHRLDPATGQEITAVQLEPGALHGLAPYACLARATTLSARDHERDGGGSIALDWSGYLPPAGTAYLEVVRALDACQLGDPGLPALATLDVAAPARFVDATATDFTAYYYAVRAIGENTAAGSGAAAAATGDETAGDVPPIQPQAQPQVLEVVATGPVIAFPNLLINEFSPAGVQSKAGPAASGTGGEDSGRVERAGESVEIRNLASVPLDLTGFRLSNGPGAPTPDEESLAGIVPAGGLFVHTLTTIDLPDAGGTLSLLPPVGSTFALDIVGYGTQGGAPTVPAGFTVNRVEGTGSDDPDATSFEASTPSLGANNSVTTPALGQSIVMNEVLFTSSLGGDYVELYNPQGSTVVLDGLALSDGVSFLDPLSSQVRLDPGALTLLAQGAPGSFHHDLQSSLLYLYKVSSTGQLQRVDQLGWGGGPTVGSAPGDALSRTPDGLAVYLGSQGANWTDCGGGDVLLYSARTPAAPNLDGRVRQLIVDASGAGDFRTIGQALAAAAAGTRILVRAGIYPESIQLENGVEVRGASQDPATVVLTGAGGGLPVVTARGVDATALLAALTLRGGDSLPAQGGGLLVDSASPRLLNVRFEDCQATQQGGGAVVVGGAPYFRGCVFRNCRATDGGAIAVLSGAATVERSLFVQNGSSARGSGVFAGGGSVLVEHCVLDRNSTGGTGAAAVHAAGGSITATYSIITNSLEGAALKAEGGGANGLVSFSCGALYGNRSPLDMTAGGLDTALVVVSDPRFCQPQALNYSYDEASPLAVPRSGCGEGYGIDGPPCVQLTTDAPPAAGMLPRVTRLHPASPNPFNPATVIRFDLAEAGRAALALYDARGRRVAELLDGSQRVEAGEHQLTWRGLDRRGRALASGVYYLRLSVDGRWVGDGQRLVLLR